MKITSIKRQINKPDRYSIFIEGKYYLSLSERELLNQKVKVGDDLDNSEINQLKKLSDNDLLYSKTLALVSTRAKTETEIKRYLKRKSADDQQIEDIVKKLKRLDFINDQTYASNYVESRKNYKFSSSIKIKSELKAKGLSQTIIDEALATQSDDKQALAKLVEVKMRQLKYRDKNKLLSYLSRQGFKYSDIKEVIDNEFNLN